MSITANNYSYGLFKTYANEQFGNIIFLRNVGIWTTSPTTKLYIIGNATIYITYREGGVNKFGLTWNGGNEYFDTLNFSTNPTTLGLFESAKITLVSRISKDIYSYLRLLAILSFSSSPNSIARCFVIDNCAVYFTLKHNYLDENCVIICKISYAILHNFATKLAVNEK